MPEIQQPDIVGNYLANYYGAQDRVQKQADRQYQMQRQQVADDQQAQQFQWTKEQHDMAAKADAVSEAIMNIRPGDAAAFDAAKQSLLAKGIITPQEAAQYDINHLQDLQMQSEKWRQVKAFQLQQQQGQAQIEASRASTQHSLAATQALRDAPRGIPGGKAPSGYQYVVDDTGQPSLQPIPGGPADPMNKPLTKEQTDAAGYFSRLRMADSRLSNPEVAKELMGGYNNTVADIPLGIGNALVTDTYQLGDQASRDLINAQLRRESGAVIGPSEFANGKQQYLPVYGDKPAVLDQKNVARKLAIYNMAVAAGPQYKQDAEDARKAYIEAVRQQKENDAKRAQGKADAPAAPSGWTVTKVGK